MLKSSKSFVAAPVSEMTSTSEPRDRQEVGACQKFIFNRGCNPISDLWGLQADQLFVTKVKNLISLIFLSVKIVTNSNLIYFIANSRRSKESEYTIAERRFKWHFKIVKTITI